MQEEELDLGFIKVVPTMLSKMNNTTINEKLPPEELLELSPSCSLLINIHLQ
jgi:hypothetical protein